VAGEHGSRQMGGHRVSAAMGTASCRVRHGIRLSRAAAVGHWRGLTGPGCRFRWIGIRHHGEAFGRPDVAILRTGGGTL
jgi:hypothetical protein